MTDKIANPTPLTLAELVDQADGAGAVLANLAEDLQTRGLRLEADVVLACLAPFGALTAHMQANVTGPGSRAVRLAPPPEAVDHTAPAPMNSVDEDTALAIAAENGEGTGSEGTAAGAGGRIDPQTGALVIGSNADHANGEASSTTPEDPPAA